MVRAYLTQYQQLSSNVKLFLAGNAIQGVGLSVYGLLFNLYLKELGYGESAIGGLISTSSLGISLMAIPAAFIIEKFHVKQLVVVGMLLSSLFYFIQIFNIGEASLFTFGLLASMFQALFNISTAPFYLRNSTPESRMTLFTLNSSINIVAHFFGYMIGGYMPEIIRSLNSDLTQIEIYRYAIVCSLSLVFCSNFMFIKIKPVPIPKTRKRMIDGLREKEWRVLGRLVLPKLCFAFGGGLIVPFLNLYLKEKFDLSTKMIGISYALLQVFIFLGIFITPALVKKTTNLKFIVFTSALSIPFIMVMGLTGNVGLVLSSFFMRGMLMNMSSPITSMFEMEHVREKECVFASAVILFSYHLVYTFSTRLGGQLIESYSFGPTFYVASVFYALAGFFYYRFFRKEDQHKVLEFRPQIESEAA